MAVYDAIRAIAPEDIRPKTYLFVQSERHEACVWVCTPFEGIETHSYTLANTKPEPLRVESVALPYVFARRHDEKPVVLDVRRHRVSRVDPRFAREIVRAMTKASSDSDASKRKRKKRKKGKNK